MNLKELDSFRIADAISFHDKLNSNLWNGQRLRPEVKDQLLLIAKDFLEELGVNDLDVVDITVSGSNAAYSYTPYSDLDLHILVDLSKLDNNEIYRELFNAKKNIYNDTHNITVHGVPVELYVQDAREPVVSLGEYSILQDKWLRIPTKRRANLDQTATKAKYEKLHKVITKTLQTKNILQVSKVIHKIKQYRKAGLDAGGEFGPENLAYKVLRKQGLIDKLYDLRDKLHSKELTIETPNNVKVRKYTLANKLADEFKDYQTTDEDYDPNGPPPGPEFKPTMPAGTVRVDVSDVYDWYKLGQHISNLKGLGKHDFGKGPPSTIMAFGSEPEEHEYIKDLEKTGLTTTDIDPLDPKQPKSIPRQKTDPTFNVNETSDEEIHSYSKLDKILNKLCEMIVKGQEKDSEYYGMVASAVLDPDNNIVAGVNRYGSNGKRVHAERVAIEKYEQKYGSVPKGSIVITTLSPCNESDDETAKGRVGESCTDYLNSKGIKKVYCGYMDPTQDNDQRQFNIMETGNQDIREECKSFADTFLEEDSYTMAPGPYAAEKTAPVTPYGNKERQFRGSIAEAFDQPYKLKWEKGDYGDVDALAKMDDGNYLSIMFNKGYNQDKEEAWSVEFFRNNSQEVTGEGDAQRVFATVLSAIQTFIKKYKPNKVIFSASKEVEDGQNSESRARLYDSLVQRYARAWGFKAFRADAGNKVIYELSKIKKDVSESVGPEYLWHGSRQPIKMLEPRQSVDTGGVEGSNQNAIYATSDPKVAIAMGLTTPGSDTGMFPNDPQMVLFKGNIRKGENVYLHKVPFNGPDGKPQFVQGGNSREFHTIPSVKGIKPVEIKAVPVNKYLNLIRQATPADLELQKQFSQKQDVNEASGYIPSEKEKNDPRFKTALTVDIKPDSIKKNAKAFGWLTSRAGIPPTAKPNGTI